MSSEIILELSDNEILTRHSSIIKSSSYKMESMIQNILDFARCQANLGLELQKKDVSDGLEKILEQVIKEAKIISPERIIKLDFSVETIVTCDPGKIAQLLSNLLGNAEAQAIPETPIKIEVQSKKGEFTLSVCYIGNKMSDTALEKIFDPFYQEEESRKKGVGLGLYIASEIAKAHGGRIEVQSTRKKTSFIYRQTSRALPISSEEAGR